MAEGFSLASLMVNPASFAMRVWE